MTENLIIQEKDYRRLRSRHTLIRKATLPATRA